MSEQQTGEKLSYFQLQAAKVASIRRSTSLTFANSFRLGEPSVISDKDKQRGITSKPGRITEGMALAGQLIIDALWDEKRGNLREGLNFYTDAMLAMHTSSFFKENGEKEVRLPFTEKEGRNSQSRASGRGVDFFRFLLKEWPVWQKVFFDPRPSLVERAVRISSQLEKSEGKFQGLGKAISENLAFQKERPKAEDNLYVQAADFANWLASAEHEDKSLLKEVAGVKQELYGPFIVAFYIISAVSHDLKPYVASMAKVFQEDPLAFGLPVDTIDKMLKIKGEETVSLTPFENLAVQQFEQGRKFKD